MMHAVGVQSLSLDIKEKQKQALSRMLNITDSMEADSNNPNLVPQTWKVLVYDRFGQDIIAPLLNVGDLRKLGVTLHLHLYTDRQAVPDVPAVYFVQPTEDNVRRICDDLAEGLYESFYLNFSCSIPRPLMETLAAGAVSSDSVSLVTKVMEQHLNFISLAPKIFSLHQTSSYKALNGNASDTQMMQTIEQIVDGLFSVLVTLGVVPIIRAPTGEAAEYVARGLEARLREHLASRNNAFSETAPSNFQRPLLVILDRNVDLASMLAHPWNYQALVHDILGMKRNRVTVEMTPEPGKPNPKPKDYDLDSSDAFWAENSGKPFPTVAEAADGLLAEYKREMEDMGKRAGGDSLEAAAGLASLVDSLPEMTEKKKRVDMHIGIATALLQAIQARDIDKFVEVELDLLSSRNLSPQERTAFTTLLSEQSKGLVEDKLRALMILFLAKDSISASDFETFENILRDAGADLSPLQFVKQVKAIRNLKPVAGFGGSTGSSSSTFSLFSETLKNKATRVTSAFHSTVRQFLPTAKELQATKIVDALMENKNTPEIENYAYIDPKVARSTGEVPRARAAFRDAIVFMVGGGNYVEYDNLQEYANKPPGGKQIMYGTTELLTAHEFLEQLSELSKVV
eukprot:GILJ01009747.1.p1 GENE.GILJ01009747.1~~GILJ01009747.1.p1  ORF type:complete len:627 (+),score=102.30 GILJ01009747.1:99-1979(+)